LEKGIDAVSRAAKKDAHCEAMLVVRAARVSKRPKTTLAAC
jgi:hypothetical protein